MNWDQNSGPWGNNGSGKKPDAPKGDNTNRPNGNTPPHHNGRSPNQPDFREIWEQLKNFFSPYRPQSHFQTAIWSIAILVAIWALSGIYMVGANQVGVVMRFGAFNRTEEAGLRYHLPAPFEEVFTPVVTAQNEIQIGFRKNLRNPQEVRNFPEESMMLTQDQNVVNVQFAVFWRVNDVDQFMFEIRDPELTIKMAAESAMREVIGQSTLQNALTEGRGQIAEDARKRIQDLLNEYKAGVIVTSINLQTVSVPAEVKAAFQDVVNARLDMETYQNQAASYVNKVIPDAKGKASKIIQEAMAYRDQKIAVARGDADRFKEVLAAYNGSKDVTMKRLYLETMETVLGNAQKIVTDKASGTFPIYPMQDAQAKRNSVTEGAKQ